MHVTPVPCHPCRLFIELAQAYTDLSDMVIYSVNANTFKNVSVYVSATNVPLDGTVITSGLDATVNNQKFNVSVPSGTWQYVTLVSGTGGVNAFFSVFEIRVLRAGEAHACTGHPRWVPSAHLVHHVMPSIRTTI